ncbi:class I adenylate cyclase [Oceanobacter mangrovi]|uniref:class I adenylate cyclase n=1 Tax=Oceanobacter mangrovi TaxID=2862510 RepID=UPI001C8D7772|nr:class I adenylate cyclase [Oceanobacter mangrovi]
MTSGTTQFPTTRQTSEWQQAFLQLNQQRLTHAQSIMPRRHQYILQLLPLLLHFNQPNLPGFNGPETPCGIDHYRINSDTELAVRHLLRVMPKLDTHTRQQNAIGGLYVMGSLGSLAQTPDSDLDIWICLNQSLNEDARQRLEDKCQRLEKWAAEDDLEVHFFIMDLQQFRQGLQLAAQGENCGTSQHLLLLDEFYRSAIWLAGRYPRWWLLPVNSQNIDEENFWQHLVRQGQVQADQWLDFGNIQQIPVNEFVGAAMWQLHKSLSGPYKALLKLMLFRSYASSYPASLPLCLDLKKQVQQGNNDPASCDAYQLMLHRLLQIPNLSQARIELIRRAFYYKTAIRLSRSGTDAPGSWRYRHMLSLTRQWHWSRDQLEQLDSYRDWTPQQVFRERNDLVNELLSCYRQIQQFSERHVNSLYISNSDIRALGSQLHAAFDARPGKIVRINPGISPSLVQHQLTLCRYPGVWQLAPGYWLDPPPDERILRQSPSLIELLAFAELNGLIGRDTRIDSFPADVISRHELKLTANAVRSLLQAPMPTADWLQKPHTTHLQVFINCGSDPLAELSKAGLHKITDRDDVLNFSGTRTNLISTVDVLTRNSWDEWQVDHFHGQEALNQALQKLLPLLVDRKQRPAFELLCFGATRAAQIRHRVLQLLASAIGHFRRHQAASVYQLGNQRFGLQPRFNPLDQQAARWQYQNLSNDGDLIDFLRRPRERFSPTFADRYCPTPLPLNDIMQHCKPNHWQLFYQQRGNTLEFYLVDEYAALVRYRLPRSQVRYWLLPTLRFLLQLQHRWHHNNPGFGGLLLFELIEQQHAHPLYKSRKSDWIVNRRGIPEAANQPAAIDLSVHFDADRQPTFYCNYEEFSIWQHGDNLYEDIRKRIQQLRNSQERYPCYLSDVIVEDTNNHNLLQHWHRKQQQEHYINQPSS